MVLFDQLTDLRCHLGAVKAHHEQLAHGPLIVSVKGGKECVAMLDAHHPISSHIESFSISHGVSVAFMMAVDFFHPLGKYKVRSCASHRPACPFQR